MAVKTSVHKIVSSNATHSVKKPVTKTSDNQPIQEKTLTSTDHEAKGEPKVIADKAQPVKEDISGKEHHENEGKEVKEKPEGESPPELSESIAPPYIVASGHEGQVVAGFDTSPQENIFLGFVPEDAGTLKMPQSVMPLLSIVTSDAGAGGVGGVGAVIVEGGQLVFKVALSNPTNQDVTANWNINFNGTATLADLPPGTPTSGTFVIPAGATEVAVPIGTYDDTLYEGGVGTFENLTFNLSNIQNAAPGTTNAPGLIEDNDQVSRVSIVTGDTVEEGNVIEFNVSLSGASAQNAVVQLGATDGTANSTDYNNTQFYYDAGLTNPIVGNQITFVPGETIKTVYVSTINNDPPYNELTENFTFTANAVSGAVGTANAQGYITDSDLPGVQVAPGVTGDTVEEGNVIEFNVSLSGASAQNAVVQLGATDGTANSTDYNNTQFYYDAGLTNPIVGNQITFVPGETIKTVYVSTINNDPPYNELTENFTFTANAVSGAVGTANAQGYITDSDLPGVQVAPGVTGDTVEEGNVIEFNVSLSGASAQNAVVQLGATDGTANSTDYNNTQFYYDAGLTNPIVGNQITFVPGETIKTVYVSTINNDPPYNELTENFTFTANAVSGAQGVASADGYITDHTMPTISIDDVMVDDMQPGFAVFTVTLSGASELPVTVNYTTADGTAVSTLISGVPGTPDYSAVSGTLTFAPYETSKTISVPIVQDTVHESNENFYVNLSTPTNASIADDQGIGTIMDIGDNPHVIFPQGQDAITVEGNDLVFHVNLSNGSTKTITADWSATFPGDAGSASLADVSGPLSGTITFTPGNTAQTITIGTIDDPIFEGGLGTYEHMNVNITNVVNAVPPPGPIVLQGLIEDNDAKPVLSINDVTVNEGDGTATFTVTLTGATAIPVSFNYATADNTAVSGASGPGTPDYTTVTGSYTFGASSSGTQTTTITVPITNDAVFENPENFNVNLTGVNPAVVNVPASDLQGVGTILDEDAKPVLSINDVTVNEGDGTATFTVTLTGATAIPVSFNYATADNTAVSGASGPGTPDYTTVTGSYTFGASSSGTQTTTITVPITNDAVFENPENFNVNLTGVNPAVVNVPASDLQGVGTILDEDAKPVLSINDVTVNEGDGTATFTVTLTGATAIPVSFNYATADNTAVSGASGPGTPDYTTVTGSYTFGASSSGTQTTTITVPITNDAVFENPENFNVNLTGVDPAVVNVPASDLQGIGTILDNDAKPVLSINDVTVNEGDGTATFTVTLTGATAIPVSFNYATADNTAVSTSGAPGTPDYTTVTGSYMFGASSSGTQTTTITVPITNDAVYENPENFNVNLTGVNPAVVNVPASDLQGIGTILDNDAKPVLSINDVTVNEGDGTATFTVTLTGATAIPVSFNYATADNTAVSGASGPGTPDYTTVTGSYTFGASSSGTQTTTITVPITNDAVFENPENFNVNLTGVDPAVVNVPASDLQGVGTILDEDAKPVLSINDVTVNEGDGTATFTVTLTGATAIPVSFNYATADNTAVSGASGPGTPDYTTVTGSYTFGASSSGTQTTTITVPITNDAVFENPENFNVNLTGVDPAVVNVPASDLQGIGTILDNDAKPVLSINDVTVNEGDGTATFTVTLTGATAIPVSFNYATADNTAVSTSGAPGTPDYTTVTGSYMFGASSSGTQTTTITVPITNDAVYENPENFNVNLTGVNPAVVNVPASDLQGIGTILDNDAKPVLSINDVTVNEGDGTATFTVTLTGATAIPVSFNYATADNTAVSTSGAPGTPDYTTVTGSYMFGASSSGTQTTTITVPITNDAVFENPENFNVNLTGVDPAVVNVPASDLQGIGTILDNDAKPVLSINDVTVNEGDGTATFTVTLTGATAIPVSFNYATADNTAVSTSGAPGTPDYTTVTGSYMFGASSSGTQTTTITVPITNDAVYENPENFNVNLTGVNPAVVNVPASDLQGIGTILDNDAKPVLSINDVTVNEGDGTATFTVTLTGATAIPVSFNYATADNTAVSTSGAPGTPDYTTVTGSYMFGASSSGTQTTTITVPITNDAVFENPENFNVNLTGVNPAVVNVPASDLQGVGTILDNDLQPSIVINDVSVNESAGNAVFTVTLSNPSAFPITVNYATANGTAIAGADYTATSGTLTFAPGATTQTITVPITNDLIYEGSETFNVNLTSPTNATIADNQGLGTILDNDASFVTWSLSGATSLIEGQTGTYAITLGGRDIAAGQDVTIKIDTLNGTTIHPATEGVDFNSADQTLTIHGPMTIGQVVNFNVVTIDDTVCEPTEDFLVQISNPSVGTVLTNQVQTFILDNEHRFVVGSNQDDTSSASPLDTHTVPNPTENNYGQILGSAGDDTLVGDAGGSVVNNYNVCIILDVSGSMDAASGTPGKTRLQISKEATNNLLNQLSTYEGVVNVNIVTFSTETRTSYAKNNFGSGDLAAATVFVNNLSANGYTNYEDGLKSGQTWLTGQVTTGYNATNDYENQAFFISDGYPNRYLDDNGKVQTGSADTCRGQALAAANDMISPTAPTGGVLNGDNAVSLNAIGIGSGVDKAMLDNFDNDSPNPDGSTGSQIVHTADELNAALQIDLIPVGADTITGGMGDDLIFGDAVNTDNFLGSSNADDLAALGVASGQIAAAQSALTAAHLADGASWDVFQTLIDGSYVTQQQVDTYISNPANWNQLSQSTEGKGDTIYGGEGNDVIFGQGGNDTIYGGSGNDSLYGGPGNDILFDSEGIQLLSGGTGVDSFKFTAGDGDSATLTGAGIAGKISGIEILDMHDLDGNDTLTLSKADIQALGGASNQTEDVNILSNTTTYTASQIDTYVNGDSGDTVNLQTAGWGNAPVAGTLTAQMPTGESVTYNVWVNPTGVDHDAASVIAIQQGVNVATPDDPGSP